MKLSISAVTVIAAISLANGAFAQDAPTGGMNAKGNAPMKNTHTVNDGSAKPGADSFTYGQARQHILNSGYSDVSGLTKGKDGVWRGLAMKGGASVKVALDFKGNVSEAGPAAPASGMTTPMAAPPTTAAQPMNTSSSGTGAASGSLMHHRHHHHRHHMMARCADPGRNGVACSGRDRNKNSISDKEDHAMATGAKP